MINDRSRSSAFNASNTLTYTFFGTADWDGSMSCGFRRRDKFLASRTTCFTPHAALDAASHHKDRTQDLAKATPRVFQTAHEDLLQDLASYAFGAQ